MSSRNTPPEPRPITEARLLAMVNASGDSFWESDVERRFVHVSDNMCRMMGYPRSELMGRSVVDFMTPEYRAVIVRMAASRSEGDNPLAHTQPIRHEGEFFRKDGSRLWIETVSVPVFDDDGTHIGYFGITRDVSERKHAEQALRDANQRLEAQLERINELHAQMHEQSIRDELTGVHTRRHFVEVAERELDRVRREGGALSLVMIDLDHFKSINDAHGHLVGDVALRAVGTMLVATTRAEDLACRLGGEEFAVMMTDTDHATALARAETWRATLAATSVLADGIVLRLTASFGVATFPQQAGGLSELLRLADHRMYRAKAQGRDSVFGEA
ncbi:diguanylate cyclase [Rhizobacter sp. J219]|uniref:sensor domain-containing diguanylate cyclase n=1 Tax=Rhizobacter sp. J219 TaxID=2898430 RepID=UPI0021507A8A|nr:diguanylate cyclase [Rhizobacter sp. J219]MCR5885220.1 diguanylate cyclase [Rhizobacter sp. J219]